MQSSQLSLNASWYLKASLFDITVSRVPTYPYGIVGLIIARSTELYQQSLDGQPRDPRSIFCIGDLGNSRSIAALALRLMQWGLLRYLEHDADARPRCQREMLDHRP